jgi:hypothetical protein
LIPLDELKAILLHPSTSYQVRDETLAELVRRARDSESWMVGLAAVVLPGVRSVVWSLVQACPDKAEDIEAETLAGLVAAIRDIDVSCPRIAVRLVWRSRKAAKRLVRLELAEQGRPSTSPVPGAPPQPWGHPDLVLIEAVGLGVVVADSAELIGSTRLGDIGLDEAAAALHVGYWAAHKRRSRVRRPWSGGWPPKVTALSTLSKSEWRQPILLLRVDLGRDCEPDRRPEARRSNRRPRR